MSLRNHVLFRLGGEDLTLLFITREDTEKYRDSFGTVSLGMQSSKLLIMSGPKGYAVAVPLLPLGKCFSLLPPLPHPPLRHPFRSSS